MKEYSVNPFNQKKYLIPSNISDKKNIDFFLLINKDKKIICVQGLGFVGSAMATAIVAAVAPQFGRVAGPAGAYALGGLEGVIGNFAFDFVRGRMANGTTAQNAAPAMEVL